MIAFSLGPVDIYRYGLFYLIAFIVAYLFLYCLGKTKLFHTQSALQDLLTKHIDNLFIGLILGVLIGGRLGHIFIYDFAYFVDQPWKIFAINEGGMSFIGGMIGVSIAIIIMKKIYQLTRRQLLLLLDVIVAIVPLGIMIGRIGNFLNQELYGIIVPTTFDTQFPVLAQTMRHFSLIYVYDTVDKAARFNTNILASVFEGLLLLTINLSIIGHRIKKRIYRPGLITAIFLIGYSVIRFLLEYIRQDSQAEFVGRFTRSQWFFVIFFILCIVYITYIQNTQQSK